MFGYFTNMQRLSIIITKEEKTNTISKFLIMFLRRYTQSGQQRYGYSSNMNLMIGILISLLAYSVQSLERTDNDARDKTIHDFFRIDGNQKILKGISDEGRFDSGDLLVSDLPNRLSQGERRYVEEFQEVETNYTFCNDVELLGGSWLNDETGIYEDMEFFVCMIEDPMRCVTLSNLPSTFESEWTVARNLGKNRLAIIGETTLHGHSLILPDSTLGQVYNFLPPATSSASNARTRNLAVNQFGLRSVIVLRVTINQNSNVLVPANSTSEISNAVFGTGVGDVTLTSQYDACSYGKIGFEPANIPEATNPGVIDLTISVSDLVLWNVWEVTDLVAEAPISNGGLGVSLSSYGHVMYQFPNGVYVDTAGTSWVAFAFRVRIMNFRP